MATIEPDEIDALARLARLSLSADERASFARQLGDIVRYLDALHATDVDGVEPWQPPLPEATPLRDDVAVPPLPAAEILREVPRAEGGLVIVPRFVES